MRFVATMILAVVSIGCPAEEEPERPLPTPCTPGVVRCGGTVIQTCSATRVWTPGTDCGATGQDCLNGVCVAATGCSVGETRCNGTIIEDCTAADVWTPGTDCADTSQVCTGLGVCTDPGAGVCVDAGTAEYYVCDGTEAVACQELTEAGRWDCADDSGTCYNYGGTFGADCVVPLGEPCVICLDQDCTNWYPIGCGTGTPDPTYSCDLAAGCVALSSGCAVADPFNQYCDGNYLVWQCVDYDNIDFPISLDCTSTNLGGGVCNAGFCEHSTSGGPCDDDIHCVGGLTCSVAEGSGVCQ